MTPNMQTHKKERTRKRAPQIKTAHAHEPIQRTHKRRIPMARGNVQPHPRTKRAASCVCGPTNKRVGQQKSEGGQ